MPNIFLRLVSMKIANPGHFCPDEDFTRQTGISPERYRQLASGKEKVLGSEIVSTAKYLGITREEIFESRQLQLFGDVEK